MKKEIVNGSVQHVNSLCPKHGVTLHARWLWTTGGGGTECLECREDSRAGDNAVAQEARD